MATSSNSLERSQPEPAQIGLGAAEHLRYIRNTIAASQTFTAVPAKGCTAMGLLGLVATGLESTTALAPYWLPVWLVAAVLAAGLALKFMLDKARAQGLSLNIGVARRFFMTLIPSFLAGGVLTAALYGSVGRELIAAVWLLLYGSGLVACGVFSVRAVGWAGVGFMALGLLALLLPAAAAPLLLGLGFGVVHLALGWCIGRHHGG